VSLQLGDADGVANTASEAGPKRCHGLCRSARTGVKAEVTNAILAFERSSSR
jgi:hypothetical protein